MCQDKFPGFYKAIMGKATELICFLMKSVNPEYYQEYRDVLDALFSDHKVISGDQDLFSLFALGINFHTQRHLDGRDNKGGMAGLVFLGKYMEVRL